MDVTQLPFNALIGLGRGADGALALPSDPKYGNHLGTVHAGVLLTLAEAASGDCLAREFASLGFPVVPVVRRLEAKFRKPAQGAIHAVATLAPEAKAEFLAALTTKGRALLTVNVDVHDASGTHALSATVEWFVARRE
ncbi:MAG: YiiD C-terminal domain-containing protein [Opitutaceae bacterium]